MYNKYITVKGKHDMKYELKRPTKSNVIIYVAFALFGVVALLAGGIYIIFGALVMLFGVGLAIYEIIRGKDPTLVFDENGFYIGETRHSYRDIEEIKSYRHKSTTYVTIIIGGNEVYKFDSSYENSNEFVKQLTLHGVEHDIFGR